MFKSPTADNPVAAAFAKFPPAAGTPLDHALWGARDLAAANAKIGELTQKLAAANAQIVTLKSRIEELDEMADGLAGTVLAVLRPVEA